MKSIHLHVSRIEKNALALLFVIQSMISANAQQETFQPGIIKQLFYFEPFCGIGMISSGYSYMTPVHDDSICRVATEILDGIISRHASQLEIAGNIAISDSAIIQKVRKETAYMFQEVTWHPRDISSVKLEPTIDSILVALHHRFALLIFHTGYIRTTRNYGNQVASQLAISILTLGSGVKMPHKYSSGLFYMIVDALHGNVSFVGNVMDYKGDPMNEKTVDEQFKNLFLLQ